VSSFFTYKNEHLYYYLPKSLSRMDLMVGNGNKIAFCQREGERKIIKIHEQFLFHRRVERWGGNI
jgi:hypothetical protein